MGEQIIRVSDLSGRVVENPDDLVNIVVTEHPDLEESVRLEALPEELKDLGKLSIAAVGLEVTQPDDETPTRHVLTKANFDKLAVHKPMEEILASAALVAVVKQRRSHNRTVTGEPLRDFSSLDHAGAPHKGKVSLAEAQLVRENLPAINERLAAQGQRPIDPADPELAKRYGLDTPA